MNATPATVLLAIAACGANQKPAPAGHDEAVQAQTGAADSGGTPTAGATAIPPGDACTAAGGSCVGVGACGESVGHLGSPSCGAPYLACCFAPATSCGGAEDFACCDTTAEFRPTCSDGKLRCSEGQTRSAGPHCPKH